MGWDIISHGKIAIPGILNSNKDRGIIQNPENRSQSEKNPRILGFTDFGFSGIKSQNPGI